MKIFHPKTKSVFLPKIRWRSKKRSPLKFSPVFGPKLHESQKKGLCPPFLCSNPLPKLQKEGPCRNFAYYFMLIILSWRPKKGGPWPNAPPKYAPGQIIDSLFSWLETDARRKREKHWRQKSCELFCCHAYSTDLIGHILCASEPRRKKWRWLDESSYSR